MLKNITKNKTLRGFAFSTELFIATVTMSSEVDAGLVDGIDITVGTAIQSSMFVPEEKKDNIKEKTDSGSGFFVSIDVRGDIFMENFYSKHMQFGVGYRGQEKNWVNKVTADIRLNAVEGYTPGLRSGNVYLGLNFEDKNLNFEIGGEYYFNRILKNTIGYASAGFLIHNAESGKTIDDRNAPRDNINSYKVGLARNLLDSNPFSSSKGNTLQVYTEARHQSGKATISSEDKVRYQRTTVEAGIQMGF